MIEPIVITVVASAIAFGLIFLVLLPGYKHRVAFARLSPEEQAKQKLAAKQSWRDMMPFMVPFAIIVGVLKLGVSETGHLGFGDIVLAALVASGIAWVVRRFVLQPQEKNGSESVTASLENTPPQAHAVEATSVEAGHPSPSSAHVHSGMGPAASIVVGLLIAMVIGATVWLLVHQSSPRATSASPVKETAPPAVSEDVERAPSHSSLRWPSVMASREPRNVSMDALNTIPAMEADLDDWAQAYGFYVGQTVTVEALASRFPHLTRRLVLAQAQFDQRFKPAIEEIERLLNERVPQWPQVRPELERRIASQNDIRGITVSEAEAAVAEFEQRHTGRHMAPVLETLLIHHPDYRRQPQRVFLDGFRTEYVSDGTGKSRGVRIALEHPTSWASAEGRRPHIVRRFTSNNGRGQESISLLVKALPNEFQGATITDSDIDELAQELTEDAVRADMPGARITDTGTLQLGGQRWAWCQYEAPMTLGDMAMRMQCVHMVTLRDGAVVAMMFMVMAPTNVDGFIDDTSPRMERMGPLFRLIAESIDFYSRYDVP